MEFEWKQESEQENLLDETKLLKESILRLLQLADKQKLDAIYHFTLHIL